MTAEEIETFAKEKAVTPDSHIHIGAAGFPEDLVKVIDEDTGNSGDADFRRSLAELLRSQTGKYPPKAYIRFHCEVHFQQLGDND